MFLLLWLLFKHFEGFIIVSGVCRLCRLWLLRLGLSRLLESSTIVRILLEIVKLIRLSHGLSGGRRHSSTRVDRLWHWPEKGAPTTYSFLPVLYWLLDFLLLFNIHLMHLLGLVLIHLGLLWCLIGLRLTYNWLSSGFRLLGWMLNRNLMFFFGFSRCFWRNLLLLVCRVCLISLRFRLDLRLTFLLAIWFA